jgi:hypothetical protein
MPGFDRTGPMGQGSQTGRKMGKCIRENVTSPDEFQRGRGSRMGGAGGLRLGSDWNSSFEGQNAGRAGGRGRRK